MVKYLAQGQHCCFMTCVSVAMHFSTYTIEIRDSNHLKGQRQAGSKLTALKTDANQVKGLLQELRNTLMQG